MGLFACCGFEGLPTHTFTYPLSVLSCIKVFIQFSILGCFYCWYQLRPILSSFNAFVLIGTSLALILLVNSISIVFIVQKFYWTKVERIFSGFGSTFSLIAVICSTTLISAAGSDEHFISMKILLILLLVANTFNFFWSYLRTHDSVSNLYIRNWGQEEFSVELAELQNDFD